MYSINLFNIFYLYCILYVGLFILLKVLTELPTKTEIVIKVPMTPEQYQLYCNLVSEYKERAKAVSYQLVKVASFFVCMYCTCTVVIVLITPRSMKETLLVFLMNFSPTLLSPPFKALQFGWLVFSLGGKCGQK